MPARTDPFNAVLHLRGAWQAHKQVIPHMVLRTTWPLKTDMPETVFDDFANVATEHVAEIFWYPGEFDLTVRWMDANEMTLVRFHQPNWPCDYGVRLCLTRKRNEAGHFLSGVSWPVQATMREDAFGMLDHEFQLAASQQETVFFVEGWRIRQIVS